MTDSNNTIIPVTENTETQVFNSLISLTDEIVDETKNIESTKDRIHSELRNFQNNFTIGSHLQVGRESVQYLAELTKATTEVFCNIKTAEVKMLDQETNLNDFANSVDQLKKKQCSTQQFINLLGETMGGLVKLIEQQKDKTNDDKSLPSSNPSTSGFSLFDNSGTNIVTSSPIPVSNNIGSREDR